MAAVMLAVFTVSVGLAMVFPLKAHEPGYKGRCKNNDETSAKGRKEIQRLPRLSLVLEFDEFVGSVGAVAGKALRDRQPDKPFESSIGRFMR